MEDILRYSILWDYKLLWNMRKTEYYGGIFMQKVDILFVIPPFHLRNGGSSFFPMGIGYIISYIEKNKMTWGVINCSEIIYSLYQEDLELLEVSLSKKLLEYSPSVIGIGPCVTTQLRAIKVIADMCKKVHTRIPVFAGGPFATIEGQEKVFQDILGIEFLVKGDGEEAVSDIILSIKESGDIRSSACVSFQGRSHVNIIENLDTLPFPYRSSDYISVFSERRKMIEGHQVPMIASRGCPYRCSYCVSGNMKKNCVPFRKRSYENILAEMLFLKNEYEAVNIIFYDDLFFSNPSRINDDVDIFCTMLRENNINMHWQIEMRPDFFILLCDSSIEKLTYAGCTQINLGIEKMSEKGLAFLGKRGNRDGLFEKMAYAKKRGICLAATFILGGKGETVDDIKNIVEYAKSLPLDFAHFNPLFVYPGTPLYDDVFRRPDEWVYKVLNDELPWGEILYENEAITSDELLDLIDYAYSEFYKNTVYAEEMMIKDRFNIKKAKKG